MLRSRSRDAQLAEDLLQDCLHSVLLTIRAGKLKHPERLSAYLRQTASNLLNDEWRRKSRQKTSPNTDQVMNQPAEENGLLSGIYQQQLRQIVLKVLNELPMDRDRQLIRRFYLQDASKTQLCAEYDLSKAHFDRVMHRARTRLKVILTSKKWAAELTETGMDNHGP